MPNPAPTSPALPASGTDVDRLVTAPPTTCLNCGAVLPGDFCPNCGQRDQPLQQPAHVFIAESASEYFGLDGRLWRSLVALLFKPGVLTEAYLEGKRVRYLRPLRLYLTATVLFFFLLSLRDPFAVERETLRLQPIELDSLHIAEDLRDHVRDREAVTEARKDLVATASVAMEEFEASDVLQVLLDSLTVQADSLDRIGDRLSSLPDDSLLVPSSLPTEALVALRDTGSVEVDGDMLEILDPDMMERLPDWAKGNLARRLESAETPQEERLLEGQTQRAILGQVPTALFLILPFFALLLKLTYLFGAGRSPRHLARPTEVDGGTARKMVNGMLVMRWKVQRWRQRRRVAKRRAKLRKRRAGRIRGPLFRARRWVSGHSALRPWRIRRLRLLREGVWANRSPFYAEHLVFALHVHAYTFLVLIPLLFLGLPGSADSTAQAWVSWILFLSIPLYYLVAQHRVYKQSWPKTIAKSMALGFVYTVVLGFGTVLAGGLALRLN